MIKYCEGVELEVVHQTFEKAPVGTRVRVLMDHGPGNNGNYLRVHVVGTRESSYFGLDSNDLKYDGSPYKIIQSTMTLIEKAKLAFKGEPEKTFIKAGILNADESFTTEGKALFNEFLLKKFGTEFKTAVVDPILADEAAAK